MPPSPRTRFQGITVSDADIAQYHAQGYWISPKLVDDDQLARLREAVDRVHRGERDFPAMGPWGVPTFDLASPKLRKYDNGWWVNAEIRQLVTGPLLGFIGSRLMGTPAVRLWHDQVIAKPGLGPDAAARPEGNVGWHQDYGYWQTASTPNMCTAWLALQDTDLSNGGMLTIAGSHKWGLIPDSNTFFDPDLKKLRDRYATDGRRWVEEPCILKAGQASFHHALCFHGSGPNLTHAVRRSVIAHLMPADCAYRPNVQWHPNLSFMGPLVQPGDRFEGPCFPQLWPAPRRRRKD